jgi:hypothetical protein
MLSFLAHGPRTAGKKVAVDETQMAKRELGSAQQRLTDATRRARTKEGELTHADVAFEEAVRVHRARAREMVAYYRGLMTVYCAANLRARGTPEVPPVLRDLPAIDVPAVLVDAADVAPEPVVLADARARSVS